MSEYVQIYDNATGVPRVKCLRDVNATPAANPVRYAGIAVPRTSLTEEVLQTQNTIHVSTFFYSGPGNPLVSVVKQGFSNAKLLGVIPTDPLHYVTPSEVADAVKVAIATNYDPDTKQISFVDAAGNVIPVFAGGLEHNAAGANGGASSGAGTTASPLTIRIATNSVTGIAYATRATNIPTDMNRDDSDISPAAVKKMMQFIKPVASPSGLNAEQLSTNAIEVPMFSNFSCNAGTRGAPRFTVPVAGGGSCAIDLGNLPYYSVDNPPPSNDGVIARGTVLASNVSGCFKLPEAGLYLITGLAAVGNANIYVYNAGFKASHPSPCLDLLFNDKSCYTIRSASVTPPYTSGTEPFEGNPNWIGTAGCNFFTITYNGMVRMLTEAAGLGFTGFTVTKM